MVLKMSYLGLSQWNCDLEETNISLRYLSRNFRWKGSVTIGKLSFWCLIWWMQVCCFLQNKDEVMKFKFLHWQIVNCKLLLLKDGAVFMLNHKNKFSVWDCSLFYIFKFLTNVHNFENCDQRERHIFMVYFKMVYTNRL